MFSMVEESNIETLVDVITKVYGQEDLLLGLAEFFGDFIVTANSYIAAEHLAGKNIVWTTNEYYCKLLSFWNPNFPLHTHYSPNSSSKNQI